MIKAFIFDLQGVLVDAETWHEEAFVKAMEDFGYNIPTNLNRKGMTTLQKLKQLYAKGIITSDIKSIAKLKTSHVLDIIKERCKPNKRVIDAVDFAYKYSDGKIAVATNCSKIPALFLLEKASLLKYFNVIITNEEVKGKVKPHPLPYLEASYRLGISSKKCLAIDDSDIGIMSAVDAMCNIVRIRNFEDLNINRLERELKALEVTI